MLLSTAPTLPSGDGWVFEPKSDGMRALVSIAPGGVRLFSRHGKEWTAGFPELGGLGSTGMSSVVDSELVVLNDRGQADFDLLGRRLVARAGIPSLSEEHPAKLYAFDLIERDGRDLCAEPWVERRRQLEALPFYGDLVRLVPYTVDGAAMHRLTAELGYEGTVAKRCRSCYFPNRRSKSWLKVKHRKVATFGVVGWRPPSSRHPGGLVVAENGKSVGVAMLFLSKADEGRMVDLMRRYGRSHGGMLAVAEGALEAEVGFTERTASGTLREAVCRRLRSPADSHT
jgi:bifunctional non-homologous end joining protein LigD